MIVNSNETKAVLTGNMEVTRGSISLNKETFGLIIKGIYEDKVLASCVLLWLTLRQQGVCKELRHCNDCHG